MKKLFLTLIIALTITACNSSPVKVSSDYDEFADFRLLRSFKWYERESAPPGVDDLLDRRIIRAVGRELKADGYHEAQEGEAVHFLVNYVVVAREKQEIRSVTSYSGYSPHYYGRHYYPSHHASSVELRNYRQGTLFIDILSAKTKKLIWRGVGTRRIPNNVDRLRRNEIVNETVEEIMKHFPPDPKDKPKQK
ncbi:DUF4136 domain-containing protein [Lentisphaera profundi]|uniref:DUF4136 domain-containing protein n=1 Tax=Lentisphaera profundi TaxID=1658616 RepID=A0ABY7W0A2_9BACT|nr:DUF4136 domain-containing protein [Lentisphaera profundi]WDE98409.1 DUF4136 domain-containing protein [Lentisphaera profundi]